MTPEPPELYFGIVRAIGTDVSVPLSELSSALQDARFEGRIRRLSDLFDSVPFMASMIDRSSEEARYRTQMNAGDYLRGMTQRSDAAALLGVRDIREERAKTILEASMRGRAFVLRSLMRPEEVNTLRRIYGPQFFCIAVFSPAEQRERALARRLTSSSGDPEELYRPAAMNLMNRDAGLVPTGEADHPPVRADYRLDVGRTFQKADLFVSATSVEASRNAVRRFVKLIFGEPFETPTRDEYGIAVAYGASLRSASLSRRVGACILDDTGEVVASGMNEVPKYLGGFYGPDEHPDNRDFQLGEDRSDRIRRDLLLDVTRRVAAFLEPKVDEDKGLFEERLQRVISSETIQGARVLEVLEYGRVVHAEMAAIIDAARRGTSVRGTTLYCTTFPCHECARHIVGSGITRVVYIEPYPKSRVAELYEDSIGLADRHVDIGQRVKFEPFIGISPHRTTELFSWVPRKRADTDPTEPKLSGRVVDWSLATANIRTSILDAEVHASGARGKSIESLEKHFIGAFEKRLAEVEAQIKKEEAETGERKAD